MPETPPSPPEAINGFAQLQQELAAVSYPRNWQLPHEIILKFVPHPDCKTPLPDIEAFTKKKYGRENAPDEVVARITLQAIQSIRKRCTGLFREGKNPQGWLLSEGPIVQWKSVPHVLRFLEKPPFRG